MLYVREYKSKIGIWYARYKDKKLFEKQKVKESNSQWFKTYWERPKYSKIINYHTNAYSSKKIGIILQGPLLIENDFTIETVRLYRHLYAECPIIVSTWKGENESCLKKLKKIERVYVIQSDLPTISGHGNINYQKVSTIAGIEYAKELGCSYVLKSRTDQRLYANNNIEFFYKLVNIFPLKMECNAKKRIIVCSLSTIRNRLYNLCDMLLFGDIEDMWKYFSPPDAPSYIEGSLPDEKNDPVGFAQMRPGEIYFATHYIESCGFKLKWTYEDSDFFRNSMFIVVDSEAIDQFWPKYNRKEYMWRNYLGNKYDIVGFKEWLINQ